MRVYKMFTISVGPINNKMCFILASLWGKSEIFILWSPKKLTCFYILASINILILHSTVSFIIFLAKQYTLSVLILNENWILKREAIILHKILAAKQTSFSVDASVRRMDGICCLFFSLMEV